MNVTSRRIAGLAAAFALLVSVGLTSASATTSPYRGTLTYGAPIVHVNCSGNPAVPTSITFSATYDATHWSTSAPMQVGAYFDSGSATPQTTLYATPVAVTLTAGQTGTFMATLGVPSGAVGLTNDAVWVAGTTGPNVMLGPSENFAMSCDAPNPQVFTLPTIGTINNPCLGTTTVRINNGSSWSWHIIPRLEGPSLPQPPPDVTIPAGTSATVKVGSAMREAEHFYLLASANTAGDPITDTSEPLITYSRACVPGHPATTFSAVDRYGRDVLVATIKPAIPGGAHVSFYRVSGRTRTLVGTDTTGPRGIASVSVPHHDDATYLAVIGATHYSLKTTTVSRTVP